GKFRSEKLNLSFQSIRPQGDYILGNSLVSGSESNKTSTLRARKPKHLSLVMISYLKRLRIYSILEA
ncbi:MAG: hypothetical protein KAT74_04245, partial [Candidatus Cloacimonetes bacterium]|nr:hypothetical protein [Candidatus Cloacimonadota bacterium]